MNLTSPRLRNCVACVSSLVLLLLAVTSFSTQGVQEQPASKAIPLIKMDSVPLQDAIRNLARQAELNYIVDPRVLSSSSLSRSNITITLTDVTAEQALDVILKNHNLKRVPSPSTTVTRILMLDQSAKPVPAADVPTDTGGVIPIIIMDEVPLVDAIKNLARQAGIKTSLDPKLEELPSTERAWRSGISVRWEKITAGQALASILDNYDLELKRDPAGGDYKITKRAQK